MKFFGKSNSGSALTGAAFLMATSAIGPGFLTQTAVFSWKLAASFGFVILVSVLLDIGAQLNIWRILTASGQRAQELANRLAPGLGYALGGMVAFGGLAFNIGNIGGCGMGLNALTGIPVETAALLSALIALGIFWAPESGRVMDAVVKVLGLGMLACTIYVAVAARAPLGEALFRSVWPEKVDALAIVTLVGGTVGGYISFAGAHRLLDAGIRGQEALRDVDRAAVRGIVLTSVMRYVLFLAAFGMVAAGVPMDAGNPPAGVFRYAAGEAGYRLFGLVMWCAAITSVLGSAYTSVSFLRSWHPALERHHRRVVTAFVLISAGIFLVIGRPVQLLVLAGAVNGFILPAALAILLLAARKQNLLHGYRHPGWLQAAGWTVVAVMAWLAVRGLVG
ncbi:MAG: divalent metal cation transporter [Saprospiraceae bacterium]|jgi:Mn2+/Fe2+ NRAMP family transporter|nr:divalent metal cation transporter [Saprospiraceae bacterium]